MSTVITYKYLYKKYDSLNEYISYICPSCRLPGIDFIKVNTHPSKVIRPNNLNLDSYSVWYICIYCSTHIKVKIFTTRKLHYSILKSLKLYKYSILELINRINIK